MNNNHSPLMQLVVKYNALLTRYALWLTSGNFRLADRLVQEAMEEAWEENRFYDTPELRTLLKDKILAKSKLYSWTVYLN